MKIIHRLLTVLALTAVMTMPSVARADESENLDADAKYAEDAPPVIPHPIADNATGDTCLVCHKTGLNGAPISPHPIRVNCTQCHVRSVLTDTKPAKIEKLKK